MRQLIVDYLPFEVRPEQITESMKKNDGKLIVRGVLQRAEAQNQKAYDNTPLEEVQPTISEYFGTQNKTLGGSSTKSLSQLMGR